MLTARHVEARRPRLEELRARVAKEAGAIRLVPSPMTHAERKEYASCLSNAEEGLRRARDIIDTIASRLRRAAA
jgi:truncated hemoglobin YjbI